MRRTLLCLLGLLATGPGLAGCDAGAAATSISRSFGASVNRLGDKRSTDKALELEVARPIGIDVESFGGSVIIETNEKWDRARVQVTRVATHGFGRGREASDSLAAIRYTVEIVPGEIGQVLRIRAATTHAEPHFQRANIRIRVPEVDGVRVHTQRGRVYVMNIEGAVDISTTDGDVRVMTMRPMVRPVSIVTRYGDIDYRVRGESTGEFDCETIGGRVTQRIDQGRLHLHHGLDSNHVQATLNDGSNRIILRTVDADIRIAVVPDPMNIGRFIVTP